MTQQSILVVDDSGTMRRLICMSLKSEGYRILEAEDGVQALEVLEAEGLPDLVLTDLNMPRMDGFGLSAAVREREDSLGLPIVMLTTEESEEKRRRGRETGVTAWLVKPVEHDDLIRFVKRFLPDLTVPAE